MNEFHECEQGELKQDTADQVNGNGSQAAVPPTYTPPFYDAEYIRRFNLKRGIKSNANRAGSALLFFILIQNVMVLLIQILHILLNAVSPVAADNFARMSADGPGSLVINAFFQLVSMTVPFIIATKIAGYRLGDILDYKLPKPKSFLPAVMIGIGGSMLCNLANAIVYATFSIFGSEPKGGDFELGSGIADYLMNILTIAIVPALFEEFAYRGCLLGILRKKVSDPVAIAVSAVFFGAMHGNFSQMPFAIFMGLLLGYLYVATGSMWAPMAVHLFNNTFSVTFEMVTSGLSNLYINIIYYTLLIIMILIGLLGAMLFSKNHKDFLKENGGEQEVSDKKALGWCLATPCFIIALIYFVGESILVQVMP